MAAIRIHLPAALRDRAAGAEIVPVEAGSVAEALETLADRHPDLGPLLFRERGVLRPHVNVFVERRGAGEAAGNGPLRDGDEIRIVPSIAGG